VEHGLPRAQNLSVSSGLRRAAAKRLATARPATFRHSQDVLHRATYIYAHTYTTPSPLLFSHTRRLYCLFVTVTHWDPVYVSEVRFFFMIDTASLRPFVTVSVCPD